MKVLSVSNAKSRFGRVIDQIIKTREPVVVVRGEHHVMISPYELPTPDEIELAAVFREMDKGREPVEEDAELIDTIQKEVRKYRAEKRSRK
jgi:PHD/YefM family antitoxin component YafN of YafNO toxin-antitoxin module